MVRRILWAFYQHIASCRCQTESWLDIPSNKLRCCRTENYKLLISYKLFNRSVTVIISSILRTELYSCWATNRNNSIAKYDLSIWTTTTFSYMIYFWLWKWPQLSKTGKTNINKWNSNNLVPHNTIILPMWKQIIASGIEINLLGRI